MVGGVYKYDITEIDSADLGVINIGEYAEQKRWKEISEKINKSGGDLFQRNKYIDSFYEILTGELLGLPMQ